MPLFEKSKVGRAARGRSVYTDYKDTQLIITRTADESIGMAFDLDAIKYGVLPLLSIEKDGIADKANASQYTHLEEGDLLIQVNDVKLESRTCDKIINELKKPGVLKMTFRRHKLRNVTSSPARPRLTAKLLRQHLPQDVSIKVTKPAIAVQHRPVQDDKIEIAVEPDCTQPRRFGLIAHPEARLKTVFRGKPGEKLAAERLVPPPKDKTIKLPNAIEEIIKTKSSSSDEPLVPSLKKFPSKRPERKQSSAPSSQPSGFKSSTEQSSIPTISDTIIEFNSADPSHPLLQTPPFSPHASANKTSLPPEQDDEKVIQMAIRDTTHRLLHSKPRITGVQDVLSEFRTFNKSFTAVHSKPGKNGTHELLEEFRAFRKQFMEQQKHIIEEAPSCPQTPKPLPPVEDKPKRVKRKGSTHCTPRGSPARSPSRATTRKFRSTSPKRRMRRSVPWDAQSCGGSTVSGGAQSYISDVWSEYSEPAVGAYNPRHDVVEKNVRGGCFGKSTRFDKIKEDEQIPLRINETPVKKQQPRAVINPPAAQFQRRLAKPELEYIPNYDAIKPKAPVCIIHAEPETQPIQRDTHLAPGCYELPQLDPGPSALIFEERDSSLRRAEIRPECFDYNISYNLIEPRELSAVITENLPRFPTEKRKARSLSPSINLNYTLVEPSAPSAIVLAQHGAQRPPDRGRGPGFYDCNYKYVEDETGVNHPVWKESGFIPRSEFETDGRKLRSSSEDRATRLRHILGVIHPVDTKRKLAPNTPLPEGGSWEFYDKPSLDHPTHVLPFAGACANGEEFQRKCAEHEDLSQLLHRRRSPYKDEGPRSPANLFAILPKTDAGLVEFDKLDTNGRFPEEQHDNEEYKLILSPRFDTQYPRPLAGVPFDKQLPRSSDEDNAPIDHHEYELVLDPKRSEMHIQGSVAYKSKHEVKFYAEHPIGRRVSKHATALYKSCSNMRDGCQNLQCSDEYKYFVN